MQGQVTSEAQKHVFCGLNVFAHADLVNETRHDIFDAAQQIRRAAREGDSAALSCLHRGNLAHSVAGPRGIFSRFSTGERI